jgi:hypothetical protein
MISLTVRCGSITTYLIGPMPSLYPKLTPKALDEFSGGNIFAVVSVITYVFCYCVDTILPTGQNDCKAGLKPPVETTWAEKQGGVGKQL